MLVFEKRGKREYPEKELSELGPVSRKSRKHKTNFNSPVSKSREVRICE